ncbi:protein of unknown function (plasmid) [Cupriavidus taiwanensis]|uniref:Uncharacterized protein n=1 Tax=Cupriavidus taiwanensis TaxID=164546 RepID=A0A375FJ13_9BURK|nr:protein of unknown function [Cupriavidus taiwanensis]SOZ72111.1 protein of unknown function [Cupriavidus taiwanensis]SPA03309.1 protein of unknown function [Cupriavidus taiwanensis]SPA57250.1 protein of unknown function [Cupriavidus taiwanensis]SPD48869.1 protein of unknown function [Cupriavidus taiwanensis]
MTSVKIYLFKVRHAFNEAFTALNR